jgi:hypothetical protein
MSYNESRVPHSSRIEVGAKFEALRGAYHQRNFFYIQNLRFFERDGSDPHFADLLRHINLQP